MDRRAFLTGGAIAAGSLAAFGLAACSQGGEEGKAATGGTDAECDILIMGGGLSGVIAAYEATDAGASVVLCEAGPQLGGTYLISGGTIHTVSMETPEDVAVKSPTSNIALAERFMEHWVDFRDNFIEQTGAPNCTHNPVPGWNTIAVGEGYQARQEFIDFFGDEAASRGAEILLNTRGVELLTADDGSVCGGVLMGADGTKRTVLAKAVILATGGFAASYSMKKEYLGTYGDQIVARAVPYNQGDGHRMALSAGGQLTRGMGRFYGHLTPYPALIPQEAEAYEQADKDDLCTLLGMVQLFAPMGIVVNRHGRRFADEASGDIAAGMDCGVAERIADEPMGYGYVIVDSAVEGVADYMATLEGFGAVVDRADSLEALADALADRGVTRGTLLRTIGEYNAADPADLDIPQSYRASGKAVPIETAPFYALQVTGACSGNFGGVKVDGDGRVLGSGDVALPGLYATACCAGGFQYNEYVGSIALSATYGKVCADTAIADMGR